jgi:hypothetical protein
VKLTEHSLQRARERLKLKPTALKVVANRAWEKGYTPEKFAGRFKKYLNTLKATVKIYGEVIYLFDNSKNPTLVTVLWVPNEFKRYLRA